MTEWQVAMLGPSRVGKTSLITSLKVAGQEFFAGSPITVKASDSTSRRAFERNDDAITGELHKRSFSPETSLQGTVERATYKLAIESGIDDVQMTLAFVDYPGGWLDGDHEQEVAAILAGSPTVLMPIDATLLMESVGPHEASLKRALRLSALQDKVVEWAKKRTINGDVSQLILVPVKCETYFGDNGGMQDRSDELYRLVRSHYSNLVKAYRAETAESGLGSVMYAPVDTIGCVEVEEVSWEKSDDGELMRPVYRVRAVDDVTRSVRGAEPILAFLVNQIADVERALLHADREAAEGAYRELDAEQRRKKSNWFKHMWDKASGNRSKRRVALEAESDRIEKYDEAVSRLTKKVDSATSGEWSRQRQWS